MAVIKHVSIKNSNYTAAVEYLTYKHDEFTNKPILDDNGHLIPREEFLIAGINCTPQSYGLECSILNKHYGKNQSKAEIKAHHYIISFDPRDRDDNGLTSERAQELGLEFARKYFPGHQTIVCTHPDGHNSAGNIHVHIVINSVRAMDVPREEFMERPGDALAGHKHHVTKDYLEFLKQQTMSMCQKESLNQVDLLHPAKVRITEREYWAQRRGQKELDKQIADDPSYTGKTKFETQKMQLRNMITAAMQDSSFYEEFQRKLFEKYGVSIHESRGRISYVLPDRDKPIRGKQLGTDFEKASILSFFASRSRVQSPTTKTPARVQPARLPSSEKWIGIISDVEGNAKAQKNQNYANAMLVGNSQKIIDTTEFLQRNNIRPDELPALVASAKADFEKKSENLKSIQKELRETRTAIKATKQYYKTKKVYAEYRNAKDKKKFREDHYTELALYEAARKELKEIYGDAAFPSLKSLIEKERTLQAEENAAYEDFCFSRTQYREIQNVSLNVESIMGIKLDIAQDQTIE
jgi:hypothetical protein